MFYSSALRHESCQSERQAGVVDKDTSSGFDNGELKFHRDRKVFNFSNHSVITAQREQSLITNQLTNRYRGTSGSNSMECYAWSYLFQCYVK